MANTTSKITDKELRAKLQESHLAQRHKEALEPMIPKMDAEAREELMSVIDESHEVTKRAEQRKAQYQKEVIALNEEYEQEINNIVKEESKNALKQFENLEKAESEKELEELESEISNIE